MEVQRHFLLVFLLRERLAVYSVEAKAVEAKQLLDLIPQLNQTAMYSFAMNISDVRNELVLALKLMLILQGKRDSLFDQASEKFLEILGLFELSLQENRAKGCLMSEYLTLKFIAGLYYYPASKLQPLAIDRFSHCFYAAEGVAQKLDEAWAVLPSRTKV